VIVGRLLRGLLSVFLAYHGVAMLLSIAQEYPPVGELRAALTRSYERTIGVHQNWTMFTPNPSKSTQWLEAVGTLPDGTQVPIELLFGEPDPHGTIWLYERTNKFERNLCDKTRSSLRAGYVRWLCAEAKESGTPFTHIAFVRALRKTPAPELRAEAGPRESWPIERKDLERWRCKK
jgi:hypothetical protein